MVCLKAWRSAKMPAVALLCNCLLRGRLRELAHLMEMISNLVENMVLFVLTVCSNGPWLMLLIVPVRVQDIRCMGLGPVSFGL
jgi:hypothetical protein